MAHVSVAERRPQLIRAAIDVMSREGVAAGTTRAIAAEAGVAQANVHYVFGSKERLYRAVIEQLTEELVDHVRDTALPDTTGFEATLGYLAARLWRSVQEHPDRHQLLIELQVHALRVPQLRSTVEENQATVIAVTGAIIEDAASRGQCSLASPPAVLARYFLAGFDGLTLQRMSSADDNAEWRYLEELVASLLALATGRLAPAQLPGAPAHLP